MMLTREQVIEQLSKYPNLESMMLGCVSGKVSEWPMLRQELVKMLSEYEQTIATLTERVQALEAELEQHAWKISPAMAQAKLDEQAARIENLEAELARVKGAV